MNTQDAITLRAAEFLQRQRFWDWSDADQAELDAWLAESDFHRVAYLRLEAGIGRVATLSVIRPPEAIVLPVSGRYLHVLAPLLAAASIALAAVVGWPLVRQWLQPPDHVFATNIGGRALLKFSDGTEVELNTNSAVRYRMTTQERTIWLDRGEAYFRVAHNAADPFTVVAQGHRVTDLGTEFLVRSDAAGLDVALVQGRARLTSESSGAPAAMLTAGDEAVATPAATTITQKSPQELADELAWRRGVLVFRNTRFDEAVREFNRYNETQLVIADPTIAHLRFTAEVSANNFEGFLRLTQIALKLRVEREGNQIFISRAASEHQRTSRK